MKEQQTCKYCGRTSKSRGFRQGMCAACFKNKDKVKELINACQSLKAACKKIDRKTVLLLWKERKD